MERDVDLVREILIRIAALKSQSDTVSNYDFNGYNPGIVAFNMEIMAQAGLINVDSIRHIDGHCDCFANSMTWAGNDMLDACRNDTIWNKAKSIVAKSGGMFSIEVLKKLLVQLAIDHLKNIHL
jgi:hypothetical protein